MQLRKRIGAQIGRRIGQRLNPQVGQRLRRPIEVDPEAAVVIPETAQAERDLRRSLSSVTPSKPVSLPKRDRLGRRWVSPLAMGRSQRPNDRPARLHTRTFGSLASRLMILGMIMGGLSLFIASGLVRRVSQAMLQTDERPEVMIESTTVPVSPRP